MAVGFGLLVIFALIALGAWRTRRWLPFKVGRANQQFSSAPFSIDRKSGSIHVKGASLVLQAAMPKTVFLDSDLYGHIRNARYLPLQTGTGHWFEVYFDDPQFEHVYLDLIFETDKLAKVTFSWGPRVTTAEWTEERVQAEVARYRAFMVHELGSDPEFPWGRAWAVKDEKAGTPTTGIRYKGFALR